MKTFTLQFVDSETGEIETVCSVTEERRKQIRGIALGSRLFTGQKPRFRVEVAPPNGTPAGTTFQTTRELCDTLGLHHDEIVRLIPHCRGQVAPTFSRGGYHVTCLDFITPKNEAQANHLIECLKAKHAN